MRSSVVVPQSIGAKTSGKRGDIMVSALVPGSSGLGSSPGVGHCVVFLGKTLNSRSSSQFLSPPRCINGYR